MNQQSYEQLLADAVTLQRSGRLNEAEAACRRALTLRPDDAQGVYFLGLIVLQQRRAADAAQLIARAVDLRDDVPEFHANLGHALRLLGRLDDAADAYLRALALKPEYPLALSNLGGIRRAQRRFDEALDCFDRATRLAPDLLAAWMNLGNTLRDLGQTEQSLAAYRRASAVDGNVADAHGGAATMLMELGRNDESSREFQIALRINPRHVPTLINFGLLHRTQKDFDAAISCFRQVLSIDPSNADAHEQLGRTLLATCDVDGALRHYDEALRLAPSPRLRFTIATLLPPIYRSIDDVTWWRARLEREIDVLHREKFRFDIAHDPPPSIVYLPYQGLEDRDIAEKIATLCAPPGGREYARNPLPNPLPEYRERERVRVAFISSLFKDQTVGLWMQGLIAQLDRGSFEVIVISTAPHADSTGTFIRQHCDRYIVLPHALPQARSAIAQLQLDVLIYAEIGMDPWIAALAHSRLAPVQCVTLGHPITSGIATIDYFISSMLAETEDAQRNYSEKLVRLVHLPVYYYRPAPPTMMLRRSDFIELKIGDDHHLYGCLQGQYKLHPSFDAALGEILRRDPNGIVLLSREGTARGENLIRERLTRSCPDVIDRIRFTPPLARDRFRALTALCNVLLAPFPFGAGDSSLEGFALDVPTVTLPTPHLKGRLTHAMYRMMNIADCTARDLDDYVAIAVKLATDRAFNESVRAKIAAAKHVLFENPAGVRDLERFFRGITPLREAGR